MKLHTPRIIAREDALCIESEVDCHDGRRSLWFLVDRQWETAITTRCDAFLLPTLLFAMHHADDIELKAPVSARLFYNLTRYVIPVLCAQDPSRRAITIHPAALDDGVNTRRSDGVLTGLSAGVDSFCTIMDHHDDAVPGPYRVTHGLFTNVGSHGDVDAGRAHALFRERIPRVRRCADELGLPLIVVDSNMAQFLRYPGASPYQQTHTMRNTAVALLLQGAVGTFLYSSTYRYSDCYIGPTSDTAYADPVVLPLLSTASLDCISAGGQYTRVAKTARIADWELPQQTLSVCVRDDAHGSNCSVCFKCCRTLLTLELLGKLQAFSAVFDLTAWRHVRDGYIATVLRSHATDPYSAEILEYARSTAHRWPLRARLRGLIPAAVASKCSHIYGRAASLPRRAVGKLLRLIRPLGVRDKRPTVDPERDDF